MAMFSRCKKAELADPVSGETVTAGVSIGPLDSLMVAIPSTCPIDPNIPIKIKFLDPALGVAVCRCRLTSPLTTGEKKFTVYRCTVLDLLSQTQRREDVKVPLEEIQVMVTLDSTGVTAPALLRDISASGVYLITALSARPGDQFTFVFRKTDVPVPLTAQVLRSELLPLLGGIGYGCRFVKLSPGYEAQLRAYVFQEERRLYKQT